VGPGTKLAGYRLEEVLGRGRMGIESRAVAPRLDRLHAGVATAVAFTPDGRLGVSAGVDGTVRLSDVAGAR
jgi:hypothetical protein